MIAELVKQYDILKRCGVSIPAPFFEERPVSIEIVVQVDGEIRVNWLCRPRETQSKRNATLKRKEDPLSDKDVPVTERSACRSRSNDTPHGLVDNPTWVFGQLSEKHGKERHQAYLTQLDAFYGQHPEVRQIGIILDVLRDKRASINKLYSSSRPRS